MWVKVACVLCAAGLLHLSAPSNVDAQLTKRRDLQFRWEYDPDVGTSWIQAFDPSSPTIELEPLTSTDALARLRATQRLVQSSRLDIQNRSEVFKVMLQQLATDVSSTENVQVMLSATSAASLLAESKEEIEQVWAVVKDNPQASLAVESKLVEWESPVAVARWRERIQQTTPNFSELLVALEGLAVVGESSDRDALEKLMFAEGTLAPVKLVCSRAIGAVVPDGLESVAARLYDAGDRQDQVLAANLIKTHTSPEAIQLQERMLSEGSPLAQSIAYKAICDRDPVRGRELAFELVKHPESNLRTTVVDVLNQSDDLRAMKVQALLLGDPNLNIREKVRSNLEQKAKLPALAPTVNNVISHYLRGEEWEGIEQAIKLTVDLQKHERQGQIVQFLSHPKPEINIRAAWALQMLKLTPETLDAVLKECDKITQVLKKQGVPIEQEVKLGFMFEAIGVHKYQKANDMLLLYIPKDKMPPTARAAAIYALGYLWEGRENKDLGGQLASRMLDNGLNPEEDCVRYVSAVALGRMGDESMTEKVKRAYEDPPLPMGYAVDWSVEQLSN